MPSGHMISREMHAFSAYDLKECVCPKAGTQSGVPIGRQLSEFVYAQDIQGQGHRAACLSRHDNSDEDRDLEPDPDLLIFVPACRGLVPVLVSS